MLCYVIELYRIGLKRLLDIQSVYRFNFDFVLHLNKTGVGKESLMTAYWWMKKHSIVVFAINRPS